MYKIQIMLISLFLSTQAFSFWRVFDCQEKRNSQKITVDGDISQRTQRGWSNAELDLTIRQDGKTIINDRFFLNPRRGIGLYEIEFWGRANLIIDTWPDNPLRLRFGRYYDAKIRVGNFNGRRWFEKLECQYIGF